MKVTINWVSNLFKDESGIPSSKRFIGILCGVSLCLTLFISSFSHNTIQPSDTLINAVAMLAFGCLGLASVDKIWGKNERKKIEE